MLLRDISPKDPLTNVVVEGLEKTAPILNDIQFYRKSGSADSVLSSRESSNSSIFRSLNENNSADAPEPEYTTVAKKIVSFDAKVDVLIEDRNEDPEEELVNQTRIEAENAGYILQEKIFEGDTSEDAEEFNGLRNLTDSSWIKTVAPNGHVVPLGNTDSKVTAQQQAIEELLKLFATVRGGATHAYMNEYLKIRWLTVAKALGYYRQEKDSLGNTIEKIGEVIIRGAGYKSSGAPLLPFDETIGSAAEKCSYDFRVPLGKQDRSYRPYLGGC